MLVFIDFDDVIFNTKDFGADLRIFFERNGINPELFKKYYYTEDEDSSVRLFDPWKMFDRIEREELMDLRKLRQDFLEHIKDLSEFIFEDAKDFFEFVGKENIYLISFGFKIFQNEKISACGADKMVKECVVTTSSKAETIEKIMTEEDLSKQEKMIFIDDRVEYVQDIKKKFPDCITFLLCRKEGRYCDQKNEYCDYEIHNLQEAQEIIKNL